MNYFEIFTNDNINMCRSFVIKFFVWFAFFQILLLPAMHAQDVEFEHTLFYDSIVGSPSASISSLDWIQGDWRGTAFGGNTEETWNASSGGSLMGMFKLYSDEAVYIYELMTISQEEQTLIMRIKHFNADLTGWEEKDKSVEFKLVQLKDGFAYFDGLTFEKVSEDKMNVYVVIENDDGTKEEHIFPYTRK
ncbi:DUF6265 family protein [Portibacter lacus]|uniref:DUF6265 domain-containing protein n=1 Tax=Portibacter lacus TaxID=1099794 RepID=A0AA37SMJ4_9BACT|nr:DUF6265 family protein [Portibacter lacus]GLR16132.1 hypothetical protein GCM10007940_07470 [Portibacter lacus]